MDLIFMWEYNLAEIVAAIAERTYLLRRPWDGFYLDPGEIRDEYRRLPNGVRRRLITAARAGPIQPEEASARGRWADELMDVLALYDDYHSTEVR